MQIEELKTKTLSSGSLRHSSVVGEVALHYIVNSCLEAAPHHHHHRVSEYKSSDTRHHARRSLQVLSSSPQYQGSSNCCPRLTAPKMPSSTRTNRGGIVTLEKEERINYVQIISYHIDKTEQAQYKKAGQILPSNLFMLPSYSSSTKHRSAHPRRNCSSPHR